MKTIAALFVRSDSIYKNYPGVDCWDISRDASKYPGPVPVIAHPPCRTWGRLKWSSNGSAEEHALAILAVSFVREYGGVLEHPASSALWPELGLPTGVRRDQFGGWTLSVNQKWFGHRAAKRTYLYICGIAPKDIPAYPLSFDAITHVVTASNKKGKGNRLPEIKKAEREQTPIAFAAWLIELCRLTSRPVKPIKNIK